GGADTPEDVNGGFQKALSKLEWKSFTKNLVHIADAPCHGRDFHKCGDDNHPNGYKDDKPWKDIFNEMIQKRIYYLFIKILPATDLMFQKFKTISEECGAI